MSFVDWKELIESTNQGLDIIRLVHPNVDDALQRSDKKFKARGEKTASASLRLKDGHYHVTDFGDDAKENNAIGVFMKDTGMEFNEAVVHLAGIFHVAGKSNWQEIKPEWETRPLKEGEEPKQYNVVPKPFSDYELSLLGPCVSEQHCKDFGFVSVKSFSYVKKTEVSITSSTELYPIYSFTGDGFEKIYQPLSYKKEYRFRFLGEKPERYIYGLDLLKKQVHKNKKKYEEESYEIAVTEGDDLPEEKIKGESKSDPRVDYVFIVSGGSDGLNLRSFGYFPIWYNSESETLSFEEYRLLQTLAKEIIYVPDIDNTGLKQALKIALKYLDVKVMLLPPYLSVKKDKRGNPCKDFKDFVVNFFNPREPKAFNSQLKKLIENALPAQFWSKYKTKTAWKYTFRPTQFYNFLKMNGFGRIKDEFTKDGYLFVHIDGNIVRPVLPVEIEEFVHAFLKERQLPIELRDLIYTKQLSQNALNKLDAFNIEFRTAEADSQYMFFENGILEITPSGIVKKNRGDVDRYIWKKKMIESIIILDKPYFNISTDKHGNNDIEILQEDNMFLNFLTNASRIHWRKELEESLEGKKDIEKEKYRKENKFNIAGPNLTPDECLEQKLHLINKIYAFGYMLHTYKSPQKPWAVYAMDNKLADISESHGGSGKSVFQKALQQILKKNHYIPGRDPRKTGDDFIYNNVTRETDYVLVDDCHQQLDYGFFFPAITGDLEVNNKNGMRFVIPFDDVPKIAFSSNYPPNNLDPSLARRLLYVVFSDYYHFNMDGEYAESRAVSDDFDGKNLFKDFDQAQWNKFYNFCAQALQFYLAQKHKIDPPMDNVTMRNLLSEMGPTFKDWADVYFAQKNNEGVLTHLNVEISKNAAFEDLKNKSGYKLFSPTKFKKSLKALCKFNEWIFNPSEMINDKNGRIMRNIDGTTEEVFYIKTTIPKKNEAIKESLALDFPKEEDPDDLPF